MLPRLCLFVVLAVVSSGRSYAEGSLTYAAAASINFQTGDYIPVVDPDTRFDIEPTTLDLKLILFGERLFTTLNYESTIKDDYTITNKGTIENVASRTDYGVTVGYFLFGGLSVFGGYKVGITDSKSVRTTGSTSRDITFTDKGPFAGASYNYRFGGSFGLSLSAAYADQDGDILIIDHISGSTAVTEGETTGLSYGIKLSKDMRDDAQIAFGFNRRQYDFKDTQQGLGGSFSLTQKFTAVVVEYTSFFD